MSSDAVPHGDVDFSVEDDPTDADEIEFEDYPEPDGEEGA